MADGPSVEANIWQHYQQTHPGQVQVIGADIFNGTEAQVRSFRTSTGSTFPLLLNAGSSTGGNMSVLYGLRESHTIINKQGIVRYNSMNRYNYPNRYFINEIQTVIDSLVSNSAGIDDLRLPPGFSLNASPNPFRSRAAIELAVPSTAHSATVTVHDVSGRRVASLWDGPSNAGVTRLEWDGRAFGGQSMRPGIYVIRARIGDFVMSRRLVRVQ